MQKYNGQLLRKFDSDTEGNVVVGGPIVIRNASDNSVATLYETDNTSGPQKNNPFVTDNLGRYWFYAEDGKYKIDDGSDEADWVEISLKDNQAYDHSLSFNRNLSGAHEATAISLAVRSSMSENPVDLQEANDWRGIFVEEFRQPSDSDSDVINRAIQYIASLPYEGTRLVFQTGRTYVYNDEHSIGYLNRVHFDLNGSRLLRANGITTSALLTAPLTVAGGTNFTVDSVPSSWKVGDYVTAFTSSSDADTARDRRKITNISGNQITINASFSFVPAKTSLPAGTRIAKNFSAFSGRPSATDSTTDLLPGINRKIFITGGEIDGNKNGQYNTSWRFCTEIILHSFGGLIQDMEFKNTTAECIVGHGIDVVHNTFENLNGSCYHLSMNDDQLANSGFSFFHRNTVKGTNLATNAEMGHSEGMITFSWGAGNLVISDNICENGLECFIGAFGSPSEANPDKWLIVSNNIAKGFKWIADVMTIDVYGVNIHGNVFHDCGDNSQILNAYQLNRSAVSGIFNNVITGNTILEQWGKPDKLLCGPGKFSGTQWHNDNTAIVAKRSSSGYNVALPGDVMNVFESSGIMLNALISDGYSGHVHFAPGGNAAGSAFSYYVPSIATYRVGTNASDGKTEIRAGQFATRIIAQEDGVEINMINNGTNYLYYGDSDTDGSWRVVLEGGDLKHQKRVAGTWVTKQTISGA